MTFVQKTWADGQTVNATEMNRIEQGVNDAITTPPDWSVIANKPSTFAPIIGTTSTTALAGNYVPTYASITGKPSTFAPTIGTTSTTAKAGNYTPSIADLPAGSVLFEPTTTRPTSRTDIMVFWTGADPTTNALSGDFWLRA